MKIKIYILFPIIIFAIAILFFVFTTKNNEKVVNNEEVVKGEIVKVDLGDRRVVIKMDNKEELVELGVFPEFTKVFDVNGDELTLGDPQEGLNKKRDRCFLSKGHRFICS